MADGWFLGLDIGTTAVKAAVFTPDGHPAGAHAEPLATSRPGGGRVEQDAEEWWRACVACLRAVTSGLAPGAVVSVGVVSQVNTHLLVDAELRPLTPAVVWQDVRAAPEARELDGRFTAEEKIRLWGAPVTLDASFLPARAAWFARHVPGAWARARWVLGPKEFVVARLTGRVVTDRLSQVRLADPAGDGYLGAAVALVDGLAERLPPLVAPQFPAGRVTDAGLGCGEAPVVVGTMDAFGAVVGSGLTRPGRAMVTCGTSLVVAGSAAGAPSRERPAGVARFPALEGVTVHAGPTQAGGDALRWWAGTAGLTVGEAVREAAGAAPGAGGVVFTPHLMGERAPLWDAAVRGAFLGLSSATRRTDLARAVLEGVAMSARQLFEVVEEAGGGRLATVAFSGGGARSDLWAQIHADVLRRPVERLAVRDAAVLGAALIGAVGSGVRPDLVAAAAAAVRTERVFTPDPRAADRLEPLFRVYTASYPALRAVHEELAAWRAAGGGSPSSGSGPASGRTRRDPREEV